MKRIFSILFLLLFVVLPLRVNALSVSKNNLTIDKGKEQLVDLYAEVDGAVTEVSFSLVYTSYDVPAYFNKEPGLLNDVVGNKHKMYFSTPVSGKIKLGTVGVKVVNNPKVTAGSINIHSATAKTSDGETINLDTQILNVTIVEEVEFTPVVEETPTIETNDDDKKAIEEEKSNMISKIDSQIVNIVLEKDVFEYSIKIRDDVEELDLKPVLVDDKYTVEVSSQKISELVDNKIVIKVSDGTKSEEYKILVKIIEDKEPVIDNEKFESSFKYKGKWFLLIIVFVVFLGVGLLLNKKQNK